MLSGLVGGGPQGGGLTIERFATLIRTARGLAFRLHTQVVNRSYGTLPVGLRLHLELAVDDWDHASLCIARADGSSFAWRGWAESAPDDGIPRGDNRTDAGDL